jgi:hypothetical protein
MIESNFSFAGNQVRRMFFIFDGRFLREQFQHLTIVTTATIIPNLDATKRPVMVTAKLFA